MNYKNLPVDLLSKSSLIDILNSYETKFQSMNNQDKINEKFINEIEELKKLHREDGHKLHEYETQLIREFRNKISEILKPLKFILIKQAEDNKRLAHVCGTCRMGADPKFSVVNENCQSFTHSNLFIADASVFPTSGGTNPALTIIANALRIADKIS